MSDIVWPVLDSMAPLQGLVGESTHIEGHGRSLVDNTAPIQAVVMRPVGVPNTTPWEPTPRWQVRSDTELEFDTVVGPAWRAWNVGFALPDDVVSSTPQVFNFLPAPTVASMSPDSGVDGTVTIVGEFFQLVSGVWFGQQPAQYVASAPGTQLSALVPPAPAGPVPVTLGYGQGHRLVAGTYTYTTAGPLGRWGPKVGPVRGGTLVTFAGTNLGSIGAVTFGTTAASFTATPDTVTATAPRATAVGLVAVTLTPLVGPALRAGDFRYVVGPEVLEYVSADGLAVTLEVERGATGRVMPPVDIWEDTVPLTPGSRYRGARHGARSFVLPIVTGGARYGRDQWRQLARALDPVRGMGRLRIVGGPGEGREIACVYQAGLDALKEDSPSWARAALMFRATDPYWTDDTDFVREFTPSQIATEWFPFFPLDLAGTNIRGEFSITNAGDAEAWPAVEVTGPGADFRFTNLTTGRVIDVTGAVPAGRRLLIYTQPGRRSVGLDSGENWFSHLTRDSSLWGLVPGFNLLAVRYVTTASRVSIRWRLRYLAP